MFGKVVQEFLTGYPRVAVALRVRPWVYFMAEFAFHDFLNAHAAIGTLAIPHGGTSAALDSVDGLDRDAAVHGVYDDAFTDLFAAADQFFRTGVQCSKA